MGRFLFSNYIYVVNKHRNWHFKLNIFHIRKFLYVTKSHVIKIKIKKIVQLLFANTFGLFRTFF